MKITFIDDPVPGPLRRFISADDVVPVVTSTWHRWLTTGPPRRSTPRCQGWATASQAARSGWSRWTPRRARWSVIEISVHMPSALARWSSEPSRRSMRRVQAQPTASLPSAGGGAPARTRRRRRATHATGRPTREPPCRAAQRSRRAGGGEAHRPRLARRPAHSAYYTVSGQVLSSRPRARTSPQAHRTSCFGRGRRRRRRRQV